jgi:outer membrane lipoprotein
MAPGRVVVMAALPVRLVPALALLVLAGCATAPLSPPEAGPSVTPAAASAGALPTSTQIWGGVIARVENFSDFTLLEVVSYPLRNQEPQTSRMTDGRFRLEFQGFLDPLDHRVGRRISARGRVVRVDPGTIGEVDYAFPVMVANEVYLWPEADAWNWRPGGVTFGIGIGIGL